MDRIDRHTVITQISEMWDAITHIPDTDPDKDVAIRQASETEQKLLNRLEFQEKVDSNSFDLLEALEELVKACIEEGYEDFSQVVKAQSIIKKIRS